MNRMSFLQYLVAAGILTILCALVYVSVQQNYRRSANDPQIQIARDLRARLKRGQVPDKYFASDSIDLRTSLSTFSTLYDSQGRPERSSGFLDGSFPQLPPGVFDYVRAHGEDRISWQPQAGVRMAMVILATDTHPTAFVATGRSLQEVEEREYSLSITVLASWLISLGLLFITACIHYFGRKTRYESHTGN